jgi:polygalacturonase
MKRGTLLLSFILISAILSADICSWTEAGGRCEIVLMPSGTELMTDKINEAINKCSAERGGTVRFTPGIYNND